VVPSVVVAAHRLPASEPPAGPRRGGNEDKGLRLAGFFVMCSLALAGRRGPTRREEMIMTSNKAQKTAARQRMAQTGEPYSVARHAVSAGDPEPEAAPSARAAGTEPSELSPEEQYAQEARAAGVPAAEIDAQLARFRDREATEDRELEAAGLVRRAEQARAVADRLEESAERAEERADLAQEGAELAQEWADEQEQDRAVERAGELSAQAELARERAERAQEAAGRAEEQAGRAEEQAGLAEEPWDHDGEPGEPGEPWDHHGEPAEPGEPWDFGDEPWEPGAAHPRDWHPEDRRMTMHRPPHPPKPPRPPRPPRPARPPRPW